MKDPELKEYYMEAAKEAERLALGPRDEAYNRADVDLVDYARFAPADLHRPTFWPLIWVKVLRYRSQFYSGASDDEVLDTLLDLQNYVRFEYALRRISKDEGGRHGGA